MTYEELIDTISSSFIYVFNYINSFLNLCRKTPLIMFALTISLVLPTIYFLIEWILDLSADYDLNFLGISKFIVSKFMRSKDNTEEAVKKARAKYFAALKRDFEAKSKEKK